MHAKKHMLALTPCNQSVWIKMAITFAAWLACVLSFVLKVHDEDGDKLWKAAAGKIHISWIDGDDGHVHDEDSLE